jgi:DNA-binding MarR family transcriptional regulator
MIRSNDNEQLSDAALLAQQLRVFAIKLRRQLRAQGDAGDLKPSQWAVLRQLEEKGPATTSALARVEGMRSQSMGAIVAALEEAGLVVGTPDPADGRQTLLSLTDHCREWIAQSRAARQDWLSRTIDARLSPAERTQLAQALPLLHRLAVEPDPLP